MGISPNNVYVKSLFPDFYGHIQAVEVAPDDYAFDASLIAPVHTTMLDSEGKPTSIGFSAHSGELIYIGNIGTKGCTASIEITDRWRQVRAKFSEIYPNLDLSRVHVDLAQMVK